MPAGAIGLAGDKSAPLNLRTCRLMPQATKRLLSQKSNTSSAAGCVRPSHFSIKQYSPIFSLLSGSAPAG